MRAPRIFALLVLLAGLGTVDAETRLVISGRGGTGEGFTLIGPDARQQLLVTAETPGAHPRDVTAQVNFRIEPVGIVEFSDTGYVKPSADGTAVITAELNGAEAASIEVTAERVAMLQKADAIYIEELRRGGVYNQVSQAGAGSTINSCAIIRFTYSTEVGVAMSWEGGQYWKDWANYIGADDESGLIEFHQVGQLNLFTDDAERLEKVHALWDQVGIPYEYLSPEQLEARWPDMDFG